MSKKILLSLCALMLVFTMTGLAGAETYVVGVENISYYPYYTINEDGNYDGYAREVLDLFAEEKGYTFEYRDLPLNRLFSNLVEQKIDFKFPDNPYWSADLKEGKDVVYSDSVVKFVDGAMVIPENVGKSIEEVKRLGKIMGFTPWPFLDLIESGEIKEIETPNYEALLMQAVRGRVDVAYTNIAVGNYQLKEVLDDPDALVFDENLPYDESSYLLSTAKHPELIEEFNQFLQENSETIEELKEKYNVGGLEKII
ncbi:MAG: substrate-binding periplasmic protein [bacterium]